MSWNLKIKCWNLEKMSWNVLECPGMSWNVLECPGMSWNVLECHGMFMECHGMSWNVMEFHGISWNVMEFDFENIVVTMYKFTGWKKMGLLINYLIHSTCAWEMEQTLSLPF